MIKPINDIWNDDVQDIIDFNKSVGIQDDLHNYGKENVDFQDCDLKESLRQVIDNDADDLSFDSADEAWKYLNE
ncbi:hypothetical protein [Xylocopilactobacillus apicola]|uniref:Uncharacterized protein n=1 Tax=Xylocopilactobacillus apicola TaxID=2932184 RepID=A0AAU9DQA1_9LACO|nr:hypothetical protein [Xylocopilactobacillus apicola]BDR58039.1 hypothetical protein XA3_04800 [Xylocopilactobacillus apicola]